MSKQKVAVQARCYPDTVHLNLEIIDFNLSIEMDKNEFMKAVMFCEEINPEIQAKGMLRDVIKDNGSTLKETFLYIDDDEQKTLYIKVGGMLNEQRIEINFTCTPEDFYNVFFNYDYSGTSHFKGNYKVGG